VTLPTQFRIAVLALAVFLCTPASAQDAPVQPSCMEELSGPYAVRRMEMGGGILLRPDGSFGYELSYGALDEFAQGQWSCEGDTVTLTGDPVNPPRFVTLSDRPVSADRLTIELDLGGGSGHPYFSVLAHYPDGSRKWLDFQDRVLTVDLSASPRPVTVQMMLELYQIAGDAIPVHAMGGADVTVRFDRNDMGRVAFAGTTVQVDNDVLMLDRFGEALRFERVGERP